MKSVYYKESLNDCPFGTKKRKLQLCLSFRQKLIPSQGIFLWDNKTAYELFYNSEPGKKSNLIGRNVRPFTKESSEDKKVLLLSVTELWSIIRAFSFGKRFLHGLYKYKYLLARRCLISRFGEFCDGRSPSQILHLAHQTWWVVSVYWIRSVNRYVPKFLQH